MKKLLLALCLVMGITSAYTASEDIKTNNAKKVHLRWVLAHEPLELFREAADHFAKEVNKKSNGEINVEVLTLGEFKDQYAKNKKQPISSKRLLQLVQDEVIQMSQTYTTDLGALNKSMYVFDLPFLFRDHGHATKVLEGDIGKNLLSSLSSHHVRGLAFTYSGGYRIIPGTKKIEKIEDFKGMHIRTSSSPVAQDTFKALGATPVPMALNRVEEAFKKGSIDQAESTYARVVPMSHIKDSEFINETNHSLFLTTILMSEKTWAKLSDEHRKIIQEVAFDSARLEREVSIASNDKTKEFCTKNGIKINYLSDKEIEKFKVISKDIYKKYGPVVGENLISSIQKE